ncbi:MAG TPA: BatA domain-containing protein [Roseimicrobium sp.]|nr:BatA domain-containing protein [Roseimicrobium sp.]
MNFLTPWFLVGAAALAMPVIFHLIRKSTRERTLFSTLMFLSPTPPRLDRKSRIENWFLLLLRCLVLLLLAAAFARPFFEKDAAADAGTGLGKRRVILVDVSASMRRNGLWDEALGKLEKAVRDARVDDEVAVGVFDRNVRMLISFDQWNQTPAGERLPLVLGQVRSLTPGWSSTYLGRALLGAVDAIEDAERRGQEGSRRPEILLISDLQQGGHLDGVQGREWPRGLSVKLEPVGKKGVFNAGIHPLAESADSQDAASMSNIRVRVTSASDAPLEALKLGWSDGNGKPRAASALDIYLPPGQSRTFTLTNAPGGTASDEIVLSGDEESFDNRAFVVPPRAVETKVLYVGNDKANDPASSLYFLRRAFPDTPWRRVTVETLQPGLVADPIVSAASSLTVIAAPLPEVAVANHRQRLERGATALLMIQSEGMGATLGALLGTAPVGVEAVTGRYALFGQIDFGHPMFAPFADPRYSDFTKIQFWRHWKFNAETLPGAKVVARFDDGGPALVQIPVGKGTLLVLAAGLQPAESQLALSSKFVPLMQALLEMSGAPTPAQRAYLVGDEVTVPGNDDRTEWIVTRPDGKQSRVATGAKFAETDQPGIYSVAGTGGAWRFAVNLAPEESRTARMQEDEWARMGVPLGGISNELAVSGAVKAQRRSAELESQQKLWRVLLAVALVLLILETTVAAWLTRRAASPSGATT